LVHWAWRCRRDIVLSVQVTAIYNPRHPLWRWRLTDYAGSVMEESRVDFPSISAAVAAGTKRMVSMNVVDRSDSAA
jgi:hypothetical protein